jgi:inorganic pyrophosphatase
MPDFMPNYLELPIGPKCPEVVNAVIEIPLEGINKYEYDKELHVFRLDRNLYSPVHYPGDYGFLRSTAWCWSTRPAFPAASWRSGPSAFSR